MTLDQQDEHLDRIDPEHFGPGQRPPMSVRDWNREKRRVRRACQRWQDQIRALRRPCRCAACDKREPPRPRFPRYYMNAAGISYECWLEMQSVDPELAEDLVRLRNDRQRAGAAYAGRSDNRWNIPCE